MSTQAAIRRLKQAVKTFETQGAEIHKRREAAEIMIAYLENEQDQIPVAPRNKSKVVRDAIYAVLNDAGLPLHRKEIYERIKAHGISIESKNPVHNLGVHLSVDPRFSFVKNEPGVWELAPGLNGQTALVTAEFAS